MTNRTKSKTTKRINDYPEHLRGPSQNRYGGQQKQSLSGYRGNSRGAASAVRHIVKDGEVTAGFERYAATLDLIPTE